jgi:hypothetical protein
LVAEKRRFIVTDMLASRVGPGGLGWGPALRVVRLALLSAFATASLGAALPKLKPINAMTTVQPGLWSIHALDRGESDVPAFCVSDPTRLLQFRHPGQNCSRFIIADTPRVATIQYSCPGAGWGRTSVRILSPGQLRLDTQGIADNAPFALAAEAKRIGDCHSQRASR